MARMVAEVAQPPATAQTQPELNTGVYCIRNKVNGKVYVGSSVKSISARWRQHIRALNKGMGSRRLQKDWDTFGPNAFDFCVIERCPPQECIQNEQKHVDLMQSYNEDVGYNVAKNALNSSGWKHSDESVARMSLSQRKRIRPKEETERAAARMRALATNPEIRRKATEGKRRYWESPHPDHTAKRLLACASKDCRKKISDFHRGRKKSEEFRRKMSELGMGRKHSAASKKKMSESQKKRFQDPMQRELLRKNSDLSRVDRKRMSRAGKARYQRMTVDPITGQFVKGTL